MKINSKTIARIASVQLFYQYEILDRVKSMNYLINDIESYYNDPEIIEDFELCEVKLHLNYFRTLVHLTFVNLQDIDSLIELKVRKNANYVAGAILRIGICEMKYITTTPTKVVINEYTNIASSFIAGVEIVNSVLDNISKSTAA